EGSPGELHRLPPQEIQQITEAGRDPRHATVNRELALPGVLSNTLAAAASEAKKQPLPADLAGCPASIKRHDCLPVPTHAQRLQHGTSWAIKYAGTDGATGDTTLLASIQAALHLIVQQMSTWEPDSLLSRLNCAETGWYQVPEALFHVLKYAI